MPAKKDSVATPLHLLQQLSHSLVLHLQKACSEAQKDAEVLLAKLEKERGKTQERLVKTRAKLDGAGNAGKSKAQTKARAKLAELDDMLAVLQARQSETLSYLSDLKRDAQQSLKLAQGITQVENAAAQALASRDKPAASSSAARSKASSTAATPAAKPAGKAASAQAPTRASRPAASRAKPAAAKSSTTAKPVEAKAPATKTPAAKEPSASRRGRGPGSNAGRPAPAAGPASAAKPAAAKKPAARKPAAAKRETATQPSPDAS